MYQKVVTSEALESVISLEEIKLFLRQLSYTPEDTLIEQQVQAAVLMVENECNRAFTVKEITITCDKPIFYLFGELDSAEDITVKLDDTVITSGFEIKGTKEPRFEGDAIGTYEVSYTTLGVMPVAVREWVKQAVAQMYERGNEAKVTPNNMLINPYRNITWLV